MPSASVDLEKESNQISSEVIHSIKNNYYEDQFYDAIIISDYCKGFLKESDIEILSINNTNTFLDTKKILGEWCKNITFIKINQSEYERTKHTVDNLNIDDKLILKSISIIGKS